MNENEVITALECCVYGTSVCKKCHYNYSDDCQRTMMIDTLTLINRKKAEVEELKRRTQNLTSDLTSAKEENERLQNAYKQCAWERDVFAEDTREELTKHMTIYETEKTEIKSEARKEFAERLKSKGTSPELDEGKYYSDYDIDRTLAEMEERE